MSTFALRVVEDYEDMSREAANWVAYQIHRKPDLLLCAATGASPQRMYDLMAKRQREGNIACDQLRVLKLDEWGGLPMSDPATCESYLRQHLITPCDIHPDRYVAFQSDAADPAAECKRISVWLDANGPIDVCILGLGANGHLGLNEPGTELRADAHVAQLSPSTLRHPMLKESSRTPEYGLTLGMRAIMKSHRILLLVSGEHKAEPMGRLMSRRITTDFPASMLWMHPHVTCFCDREAAVHM